MMQFEEDDEKRSLILRKGVYPYEHMDSFEKFNETSLPPKEAFYSKLTDSHISDDDYEHAKKVWKAYECETLGDYHDLYLATHTLADVFENFRKTCLKHYGLDPAHYYTSPGLRWDALLKYTNIKLELLTDCNMYLFIEKGMRGGISTEMQRYAKANNPHLHDYDPDKETSYILYLDANNLYGWAMSQPLPVGNFRWMRTMPTEKQIMSWQAKRKTGFILEVDLEYPKYIRLNTELRKKATSYFEKNLFKLMNNSVFGKTMEKLVRADEHRKLQSLLSDPLYAQHSIFGESLAGIQMHKDHILMNRPVYTGMCVLELPKTLMYNFYYNHLEPKYGSNCQLLYTDTDSLLLDIKSEDVYKDMGENLDYYDTSDFPKDHPLYSQINKKVLGKMKDECAGSLISEAVCLKSKMYSILLENDKNIKKAKGTTKAVTKK